ncbi:M23 family metallopeptidase [Salmonella enterica]|nr:M23 family metallopeptidase [Salmonella enterica]
MKINIINGSEVSRLSVAIHLLFGHYAVEIKHGNLLLRYGEIANGSYTGGASVKKGQIIAKVGRLQSGSSMLHLEIYTNAASSASLTTRVGDFRRRSDTTNLAPYLNEWKNNLPKP